MPSLPGWIRSHTWIALLATIFVVSFLYNVYASDGYLSVNNLVNLFELSIEKVIVVIVMTFVIIAGEIDLSVASVMGFSASLMAWLHGAGSTPFIIAILIALGASGVAGYIHGWVITRLGLPSLVVTLAGLIAWRGAARIFVEDQSIGDFPDWFDSLGKDELVGPLPFSLLLFIALAAIACVVLHRSEFGRYVYVIGNNADVARFAGVNVQRVRMTLLVSSSLVAGMAGILFAARLGSVRGDLANGYELEIITVVLLGGVSIFGGSGRLSGVLIAILIFLNIRNGLGLANIDGTVQTGVIGAILIASLLAQNALDRLGFTRKPLDREGSAASSSDEFAQATAPGLSPR